MPLGAALAAMVLPAVLTTHAVRTKSPIGFTVQSAQRARVGGKLDRVIVR